MIGSALKFVVSSAAIYLCIALGLILSQRPGQLPPGKGWDFGSVKGGPSEDVSVWQADNDDFLAVRYRKFGQGDQATVVLVHGSGWHGGGTYIRLAESIATDPRVTVLVPDLPGHGLSPDRRGDVDYIGQMEDTLDAFISANRTAGRLVMVGHSSGGGLVIRYAGGAAKTQPDAAVLIAPYIHHRAGTLRPDSTWAYPLVRRIIGLNMLNWVGVTWLNHLPAIQIRVPDTMLAKGGTDAYSYRLNTAFAPRNNWGGDVGKLPPFDLVAGADDEAFVADTFETTLSAHSAKGTYHIVDDLGHLDILLSQELTQIIRNRIDTILRE